MESTQVAADSAIQLLLTGDIMLGRLVNRILRAKPPEYPWGDTLELIREADWRCSNLECVLSCGSSPHTASSKLFRFRSDPANVGVLQTARIDAVSLANNHTLDSGGDAMLEMLRVLNHAGIAYSGVGAKLEEASRPAISVVKGVKIALLSFTDNEPDWNSTATRPGIFYVPVEAEDDRTASLLSVIRQTRLQADFVVVAAHWGTNWGYRPATSHAALAHRMIEAGADLIFGHSPHVYRGIEIYQGCPILYSTGDFIDDYAVAPDERNDRSFLFFVTVEQRRVRCIKLIPTVIQDCQALVARDRDAAEIAAKMKELSEELGTLSVLSKEHVVTIPVLRA